MQNAQAGEESKLEPMNSPPGWLNDMRSKKVLAEDQLDQHRGRAGTPDRIRDHVPWPVRVRHLCVWHGLGVKLIDGHGRHGRLVV